MRRIQSIFAISTCLAFASVDAQPYSDPYYCCPSNCWSDCPGQFDVFGDYLYWEARQDQLQYAADLPGGIGQIINFFNGTGSELDVNVRSKESAFEWQSGFRVGMGYYSKANSWDVQLFWTRLHETTKSSIGDSTAGIFSTQFIVPSIIDLISSGGQSIATSAQNKWNFQYDIGDLQMGAIFYPVNKVYARPYAGVKGARIYQHTNTSYGGIAINDSSSGTTTPLNVRVKKQNNFLAIGPSFGVDTAWKWGCNASLVGGVSLAGLYGKFRTKLDPLMQAENLSKTFKITRDKNFARLRPTMNGYLGMDFGGNMWNNCLAITLGVTYEVTYWWNQWQVPSSAELSVLNSSCSPQGDLMLQGLTVHLELGF